MKIAIVFEYDPNPDDYESATTPEECAKEDIQAINDGVFSVEDLLAVGTILTIETADQDDMVNHPPHYNHPSGIECIQITECLSFTLGNAVKYIWRHDAKNGDEDLAKARWYLRRTLTSGCATHLPPKACNLLHDALERQPVGLKHTLLSHIKHGNLQAAINIISVTLGDHQ